ncbi:Suppressor of the cold-sensitive snRNP bioproteinsis mutant brr1-1 [Perkinsus chesapeaki]|uniref:subtilisin n=1 Tax=Perkinsus chesapeaki TaxID=330153 RepID=A0A7J6MNH7_PERCH|nr:Suppressor of the cold-sensitive snRNP bioproteinsis mutant brr1-1 [Perkinsus chesapeaki]
MFRLLVNLGYFAGALAIRHTGENISGMANGPPVNDPLYKNQASYLEAINVPAAWKRLASTKVARTRVTVALIDTGVKPDHPDLIANLVKGYNVYDHSDNTGDQEGHGTEMAGILGATINNREGIAGVMDLVNIFPIYEGITDTPPTTIAAIDYVIRNRKSKGITFILMASSDETIEPAVVSKIKEADKAGILMIVTAGNKGKNITTEKTFPCSLTEQLSGVLCVAATEQSKMQLPYFSNFASYVDIAAPGVNIMTTGNDVNYKTMPGTSPAAGIVAGVAAMLYSVAPKLTPADVEKILKDTSRKGLKDSKGKTTLAFGRVDADKAVAKLIPR